MDSLLRFLPLCCQQTSRESWLATSMFHHHVKCYPNRDIDRSRANTWLGNDETHYIRRWQDKQINDLKRLIQLTINWIHNTLLPKKYLEDME